MVEGLAVVDRAELEFGAGLNVLTGETGAGKSIVLGALSLLAGGRASSDAVREGAEHARVEAVFRLEGQDALREELVRRGLDVDDELVVTRSLSRGGRSRARLAGQLVPVGALAELFAGRLEISSQHESQALLRPESHGRILDGVGGLLPLRDAVSAGVARLRELDAELRLVRERVRDRESRRELLAHQVREIDAAGLDADELEALRRERARLVHAERLGETAAGALAALSGDPGGDAPGAGDLCGEAARRLDSGAEVAPELAGLAERVRGAELELRDAALELERFAGDLEADPARLGAVEERLAEVDRLRRKYGADLAEIAAARDAAAAELESLEGADARAETLLREREGTEAALRAEAARLSAGRARVARRLGAAVEAELRELGMPGARFAVTLPPAPRAEGAPCGPSGAEAPAFQFAASPDGGLRPLHKVVSGGELSRLLLAVKNAARGAEAGMVLVFDEVDAGVGGRAADRVGRALSELAGSHQVLCITHLPQIAACADRHFRVEKTRRGGRTQTCITPVQGALRVEEIARMAGGARVEEATRRHARALLDARRRAPRPLR